MFAFVIRRSLSALATLVIVSVLVFSVLHAIPGDPALIILGPEASPSQIENLRREMNLDRPLWRQYLSWIGGVFRGNFGESITYEVPVGGLILDRLSVTLPLVLLSLVLSLIVAIPLGMLAAAGRGGFVDWFISLFGQLGLATPSFWLGLLLISFFAVYLDLFPSGGFVEWAESPWGALFHLLLPALSMAAVWAAELSRMVRSKALDVFNEMYVQVARAKGVAEFTVVFAHVLKNVLIETLTVVGLQVGRIVAGTIIIEQVFVLPGLGKLLLTGVWSRDFPLVQLAVMFVSLFIVIISLGVDMLYGLLDPRIRVQ